MRNLLTREQAILIAGDEIVAKLDLMDCDFTNVLQDDGRVEFSASIDFVDADELVRLLMCYYYQYRDDLKNCDDLGSLKWVIEGYAVV